MKRIIQFNLISLINFRNFSFSLNFLFRNKDEKLIMLINTKDIFFLLKILIENLKYIKKDSLMETIKKQNIF